MEKKLPSVSLETLVFLCCGSRRKCFALPLTKCFSSVPPSSNLLFCLSLNPSIPPFPVEIFYFWMFISLLHSHEWQDRISPYQINTISNRQVMRIKKIYFREVLIHYRIHRASIMKIIWQTIRRITHVTLGVKGSIQCCRSHQIFIVTLLLFNWKWPKFGRDFVRNYFAAKMRSKTLSFLVV